MRPVNEIAFFLTLSLVNAAQICNKYCDYTLHRELPNAFEFHSIENGTFHRRIAIYGEREGGMIFAKLSKGKPGDTIWLERSWDSGRTWNDGWDSASARWNDNSLGKTKVGQGSTEASTKAFNVDGDVEKKQVAFIRACARFKSENQTKCTDMYRVPVCIDLCDNSDRGEVMGPVSVARYYFDGLRIEVLASSRQRVIYGRIHNAEIGDEVWLERSWDGGLRGGGGRRLGHSLVKEGSSEAFTTAFNVDYKIESPLVGLIRVCGNEIRKKHMACSSWHRAPNCNKLCDDTSGYKDQEERNTSGNNITDPETVARAEVLSRSIEVIASRIDNVAYGRLSGGGPMDGIWLERTFTDGKGWEGYLGVRMVANGEQAVETSVYNYDIQRTLMVQMGKIRACVRPFHHNATICTEWSRPPEPPTPAPVRLIPFEDCVISILEYMRTSGDSSFSRFIHISTEEAVIEFKKSYCQDYGSFGNCHECFREVNQRF